MTAAKARTGASIDEDLAAVRADIEAVLDETLTRYGDMTSHEDWWDALRALRTFVFAAGKRTRPTFCYLGWRACGGGHRPEIARAAASLELFHTFALIHDDVMDDSDTRRGGPTAHISFADLHRGRGWRGDATRFGRNAAILWGDLCLLWSDRLFRDCGITGANAERALDLLHRMRSEVLMGQYLDIRGGAARTSLSDCLHILLYKSARYTVERPLQIGAALAGGQDAALTALSRYGIPVGEAFQLRDDVLGAFGDDAVTGKSTLTDLRDGKATVLMAYARERADPKQATALDRWYGAPDLDARGADTLRQIMVDTGSLSRIEAMIAARTDEAVAALGGVPIAEDVRAALTTMARTLSGRVR